MKKYWIIFYEYYCPVCGHTEIIRERIYDKPKPEEWEKRHVVKERYDWCNELASIF